MAKSLKKPDFILILTLLSAIAVRPVVVYAQGDFSSVGRLLFKSIFSAGGQPRKMGYSSGRRVVPTFFRAVQKESFFPETLRPVFARMERLVPPQTGLSEGFDRSVFSSAFPLVLRI